MRLIRFGPEGKEKPGLLKKDAVVDLRAIFSDIPDIGRDFFENGWLEKVARLDVEGVELKARLGCPVQRPSKLICLGINYTDHKDESGFEKPSQPQLFCKTPNTLCGPSDPIVLPRSSGQVDWEVELAVVIGRRGKRIAAGQAVDYVAGYCVMNDVSARQAQFSDTQWFRGKSFDTFAPLGPALVTADEIEDVQNLALTAIVDGVTMQASNTRQMIFNVAEIIAYVSEDITLEAGDIISTGTPSGVGIFRDPPVVLKAGCVVECRIQGLGAIVNEVVAG